jgi:uridine phosphorylase
MPSPKFPEKYTSTPLLRAADLLAYRAKMGKTIQFKAHSMLLAYQPDTLIYAVKRYRALRVRGLFGEVYLLQGKARGIAIVGKFGIGAPAVAVVLEEMAALGVRRCISAGIAGALQSDLVAGAVVLAETAIRDEGTSYHYSPPEVSADASSKLTNHLSQTLSTLSVPHIKGKVWTTDAPYRETAAEIAHYQQQDVLMVEMEAAAMFIVSTCLGIETACSLVAADNLSKGVWKPPTNIPTVEASLHAVVDAAVETLSL